MQKIDNLDQIIVSALREDIGDGDHSTLACIPPDAVGTAKMVMNTRLSILTKWIAVLTIWGR